MKAFPALTGQRGNRATDETRQWPTERRKTAEREVTSWREIPQVQNTVRDAADNDGELEIRSRYYVIRNEGSVSYLKKKMTSAIFEGYLRMMRAYNSHGREQDEVVQMTCDAD